MIDISRRPYAYGTSHRLHEVELERPRTEAIALFSAAGLSVREIHHGHWPGRDAGLTFQDFVVADRM